MKKYLLPQNGNFYKANMHVHSDVSDGKMTPEEVKRAYMEHGYSIVAYTDHDIMIPHIDLKDENFLPITSHEIEIYEPRDGKRQNFKNVKGYHLNFYSKKEDNVVSPAFCERFVRHGKAPTLITDEMRTIQHEREYSYECVNDIIAKANDAGFLVSYNHVGWSIQDYTDYINLKGVWGVEIYNTSSVYSGFIENEIAWLDINKAGVPAFPLATDDAHAPYSDPHDCFGGWIQVKAEKLDYDVVMQALENGDFYASTGPEIHELYMEDGVIHVKCSEAALIAVTAESRFTLTANDNLNGRLTSAAFDVNSYLTQCKNEGDDGTPRFLRVFVVDKYGKTAYSRCYYYGKDF